MVGFLDTLTNAFTGDAYTQAANQQRQYLGGQQAQTGEQIQGMLGQGLGTLTSGQTGALGSITGGVGAGTNYINAGTLAAIQALYGGQGQAGGALTSGQANALSALGSGVGQAAGAYNPLLRASNQFGEAGSTASNMSADALGLNGAEGMARARATFQADPGYQFALGQGLDAVNRNANAAGMSASGNQLRAAQTYGQGLADQQYQQWLQSVGARGQFYSGLQAQGLGQAGTGQANAYLTGGTGAGNIYTGTGTQLANLFSGTGTGVSNLYSGQGTSLANLAQQGGLASANVQTGTAQQQADLMARLTALQTGYNQNLAGMYGQTYGAEAAAQTQGSNNLWNLVGNLANAGARAYAGRDQGGSSARV